ncbi:MAG TPA: class I SAM-dependent methyltransferase [Pirellulales bacterium]|nr:class I SAM-dependent methyltransferase [Pirellulales bacterium]
MFEYPWAAAEINKLGKHLDILEVGGGLSGLQFTLASQGHQVTNVDPGLEAEGVGFELPTGTHRRMCSIFGAPVRLISTTIQAAKLPDQSFDVILSLSALEHFSPADVCGFAHEVKRLLRPQGRLIMTADLFIDVQPFCSQPSNKWGTNINLKSFLEMAQLQLLLGNRAELCGFDEFKADAILGNSSNYLLVPPSFVQCVIAGR